MPQPDLPDLSGLTLLIVDDNDDALEMLGTFLRARGAHILQARNAATALAYDETGDHIDAVVTDLSLPFMDGVELIQQLRQRHPMRPLPTIALTGVHAQPMNAGGGAFNAFLQKPVNLDELCRTIRSLIDRR